MANYTQNYQLHQWEPQDPFLRTDFNQDLQKIDTALDTLADQSAALEATVALCGNCKMDAVQFVGNGTDTLYIRFPTKPDFFLISAGDAIIFADVLSGHCTCLKYDSAAHASAIGSKNIIWNDTEAELYIDSTLLKSFNHSGTTYYALAFSIVRQ